jgi:type VI secretion system protein ImpC
MNDSKQNSISNLPRVQITYDREENGAMISYELPCVIGIIADMTNVNTEEFSSREFININQDNYNKIISSLNITIDVSYSNEEFNISSPLAIKSIEDFHPINIIKKIPELDSLLEIKNQMQDLLIRIINNNKIHSALNSFIKSGTKELDFINPSQLDYISKLFDSAKENITFTSENASDDIRTYIATIDNKFSGFLNYILRHKDFQRFESTWRGIYYLIQNSKSDIKIKLLHATIEDIRSDLSAPLDKSSLFHKIYEQEYGTLGGSPYSLLLWDYYISSSSEDVQLLHNISSLSAISHSPSCLGVSPEMLDVSSFENLYDINSLNNLFESATKIEFNGFRDTEDSRYISLVLPKFMTRAPYGNGFNEVHGINYNETVATHSDFLWSNSVYAYGQKISESFSKYGWFSFVIGVENGGKTDNLPIFYYTKPNGDFIIKCPTEIAITDRRELELSKNGFISLCYAKNQNYAVFFSGQSCQKSLTYDDPVANGSAKLSANFVNIMNIARFAQYCKIIIRNKIGTMMDANQMSLFLNKWISKYVILGSNTPNYLKLKYPLTSASVTVVDQNDPGWYTATIYITPHKYLQGMSVSLRMVTKLPKTQEGGR